MPNTNEYHLYIHVDEKEKETESPVSNSSAEKKKDNAITKDAAQKVGAAVAIYKTAKGFAQQLITHQVSTIELRTGASEYQQKMQFMYNIGNSALGILESIALGAAVGGGAPGALVGCSCRNCRTGNFLRTGAECHRLKQNTGKYDDHAK